MQLAIDGSGDFLDISIFNDKNELLYCLFMKSKKTHSQQLVGIIDNILKQLSISLEEIKKLYCITGPGRHTSTRVVISTIKGLFFKKNIEAFEVNSLDLAAASYIEARFRVIGEMFSKEAYCCDYEKKNNNISRISKINKLPENEIKNTTLPIIKSTDPFLFPKTPYVFKIEKYMNRTDIFSINPFY